MCRLKGLSYATTLGPFFRIHKSASRCTMSKYTHETGEPKWCYFCIIFWVGFCDLLLDCFIKRRSLQLWVMARSLSRHSVMLFLFRFSLMLIFVIQNYFIIYSCTFLHSKIVKFSTRELSDVKRVSSHHLRLLGFKPLDYLKDYHNLRPSTFIYPSDEVITLLHVLLNFNLEALLAQLWIQDFLELGIPSSTNPWIWICDYVDKHLDKSSCSHLKF